MIKILFRIIKKIILGMLLLFAYNTFLTSMDVMVPINVITIIIATLFDVPGIIGLVLFSLLNF